MGNLQPCPDEAVLQAGLGAPNGAPEREALVGHIDHCSECRRLLAEVLRSDAVTPSAVTLEAVPFLPERSFQVGERVLDRFEVVRFVARGGMGEVFEVRDHALDETLALKTVAAMVADEPKALARFRREAQLARRVTHPNVCRILEFGCHRRPESDGVREIPFLIMEYLRGRTLRVHVRERGPMREEEIERVAGQMADGLRAIHAAGIVHRDFKSDNVHLVDGPDGPRAVLVDFGLARPLDSQDGGSIGSRPALVGTPQYMAPEQLLGEAATVASDLYAFGVVLFEMWTDQLPFGEDAAAPLRRVAERAPRLGLRRPDAPRRWEAIVERCLARAPEDRFRSVDELVAALQRSAPVARRWGRRPALAAVGVLALGLAGAAWRLQRSPRPANAPSAFQAGGRPSDPVQAGAPRAGGPPPSSSKAQSSSGGAHPAPDVGTVQPRQVKQATAGRQRLPAPAEGTAREQPGEGPPIASRMITPDLHANLPTAGDPATALEPGPLPSPVGPDQGAPGSTQENTRPLEPAIPPTTGEGRAAVAPASARDGAGRRLTDLESSRKMHPDDLFDPFE